MKKGIAIFLWLGSGAAVGDEAGSWAKEEWKTEVPGMRWVRQDQPVHSLIYEGEEYEGRVTEVFAFYASPVTLGEAKGGEKFPGVVLIHGGGGTAFAEWVWSWAKRGYAALAMDLAGERPVDPEFDPESGQLVPGLPDRNARVRLERGGPGQGHAEKFDSVGGERSDDWPYHAVASVIKGHSLLRSIPEVDAERTAVTGISWGGYTTCLVASLDERFRAAVPVYGCGFLHEGESVQKASIDKLGEKSAMWVREYDPGSLLPRCRVPVFLVNGTHDVHYPLDSYVKTWQAVPGEKLVRIELQMGHSHSAGWAPQEIGWFIDEKCRGGVPLPRLGEAVREGGEVRVICESETALVEAKLHYTVEKGLRSGRAWETIVARIEGNRVIAAAPPEDANTWLVTVTDDRGAMVSTAPVIVP